MMNVRLAKIEDIDRISLVLAKSWKTAYRGIVDDDYLDALKEDHWVAFLTKGLNDDAIFSMVLCDGQEIVGVSVLTKSENEGKVHLISLYLLPDKIGHGLGHLFYSEIEKEIVNRGFNTCILDVLENNKRAIRFYEEHGFTDTDTETPAVLGEKSYICKVFVKTLREGV